MRLSLAVMLIALAAGAPAQTRYSGPRTADGKPDLNGIWQSLNTANWDLLPHAAAAGPVLAMGAAGAEPPGLGVVEGDEIPYLPAAAAQKKKNGEHWLTEDPEVKCFLPGVPRATYLPYPFQIVQTPGTIVITYQFASATRLIPIKTRTEDSPADSWMGDSYGKWDGDTLVVDVKGFTDGTWLSRAGDFHSDELHVIERYTPLGREVIQYEATIEDPKTFTRPWTISMPLYRHMEKNAQLLEFKCVEFVEELMYGPLRKQTSK
jgi:hypothetical protein